MAEEKNFPVFANAIQRRNLLSDPPFLDGKSRHANAVALVAELDRTIGSPTALLLEDVARFSELAIRRGADPRRDRERSAVARQQDYRSHRERWW